MSEPPCIVVRGIIVASDWKTDGEVSAVDIAGYDEQRFRVVDNETGRRLRSYLKKRIIAQGRIGNLGQLKTIQVDFFQADATDGTGLKG